MVRQVSIDIVGLDPASYEAGASIHKIADAVARAVTEFGFRSGELRLLSHYVNTVFRLSTDSGQYAVRAHRAANRTTSELDAELTWLDALSSAEEIRVPSVQKTTDGNAIVMASLRDVEDELPVSILEWMTGQTIGDEKGTGHFKELGRMTAALHRHAQAWLPSPALDRPTYDSQTVFRANIPERLSEMLGSTDAAPIVEALSTLRQRLQSVESELGSDSNVFGLIHGDLSFGNVLFDDIGAIPIDFDDCGFGYFIHDLVVPLAGAWTKPGFKERYQAFIVGYRQILELPSVLLRHTPVFLGLRSAQLIMDYAGAVPWAQGILDQYRTRLLPALEASDTENENNWTTFAELT